MLKKRLALILALALIISLGTVATSFAASNDDLIQALKDAKIPETYIIQAENYLKTRELTEDEANAVIANIEKAVEIMEEAGTKDITKLSAESKKEIIELVSDSGEAIGITVTIDKLSDGTYSVVGTDSTGNEVVNFTSNEVKQTGIDYTILFAGFILIIASSFFFIKKRAY
jgi:ABC-type transport system substrate-binding protein